ncbi:bifunctional sugar phosphate isomerase/epimerase/4-hydroxyphenylpyruvate dioxygenase family protein [Sedimenticola sp.]|uniref:bifunctional sugar phosphate isomerase/epimerase/4-hydroxyphenylpyruvate dioxygenase family protein n=1 Tax=Sedimenticola sp. TaxID=1940285 RepID=UPI003D127AB9
MKFSVATVSIGGSLPEKLEAAAEAGYQGVEIFESDLLTYDLAPTEVGKLVRSLGLEVVAFQPFRDFECMPEPQRTRAFERAKRKFALMNELGAENILVCSNVSVASLGGIDRAAADLAELGDLAQSFGIQVGYEALAWGRHVSDYRDAWEIVKRVNHPNVGIILDSFHILSLALPVDAIRSIPADRIVFVQIADAPKLNMDILQWSRHFRNLPGQGDLPISEFMLALCDTGYDSWLSLEIFNDQFRAGPPRQVAADGVRSLAWMLEEAGKLELPARPQCETIEFLEFAVDDSQAEDLSRLFKSMGFKLAGAHKSKAVEHWTQGDIHLVINREQEGFAHSYHLMHGPSVCAMGIKLDSAEVALDRATSLLAKPYQQAVGPGELHIPAVRGPGGSLIYLVESGSNRGDMWEIDFEAISETTEATGLLSIDHVAQAMTREEVLRWRLFYLALFDFDKTPQVDIADPSGIVESQVVQSSSRGVRICLNASESTRTMAARFLTEFLGSGVQHIAFATRNLFATVEKLRAHGVELLHIPQNYYEDLEARFGLDDSLIQRMKALNVLYDQDENGCYYQVYTEVFANRFFFEFVQREQRYDGFGAINAPIRLAAQSTMKFA